MPRGGKGKPTPGENYGNRTDYNSGDQYGDLAAREERIAAVPITQPTPPAQPQQAPQQPLVAPGAFDRPTDRPMEPVTSGLPTGAGPGPEALGMEAPGSDLVRTLRSMYARYPHPDILDLILFEEEKQR